MGGGWFNTANYGGNYVDQYKDANARMATEIFMKARNAPDAGTTSRKAYFGQLTLEYYILFRSRKYVNAL